jgi:PAS domain-containing protein
VYDLFGLQRGKPVLRSEALTFYAEPSRAAMEKLRDYALRHRRGFTLDVELRPADGGIRWMRIVGAPVCAGSRPIRLQGFKRDVSAEYRTAGGG